MPSAKTYDLDHETSPIKNIKKSEGHTIFKIEGTVTLTVNAHSDGDKKELHSEVATDKIVFLGTSMPIHWDEVEFSGATAGAVLSIFTS